MSSEQLQVAKTNIILLIQKCIDTIDLQFSIRMTNALYTLSGLFQSLFLKTTEIKMNPNIFLTDFEIKVEKIQHLLNLCQSILGGDSPGHLKDLCLKILLLLTTGLDNINENRFIEFIMGSCLFENLIQLLCDPSTRQKHGYNVVLLITLLVNYRKYDTTNPYIVKLSILDNELALNGYGQVITASLSEFVFGFSCEQSDNQNASWLSSITNIVGNMFISEEGTVRIQQMRANNALILALYEAIHLNRNFITTLAQTQTDSSSPPSPCNTLSVSQQRIDMSISNIPFDVTSQPSNLLVTFFTYCSIVMQNTKTESGSNTVKLCFIILGCITEDQYANSLMHDVSLTFKVHLYRLPMRHRKFLAETTTSSQPLVCTLLDLLIEFILSHMMKKFPMELYILCVNVIQRILCYQKRCKTRINFHWRELWTALLSLLRFIVQNENYLAKKMNIFHLSLSVVNILNFFITYGDTFLPTPGSYDELYYEIIRMHQVFDNVHSMGLRYTTNDGEFKNDALKLNNSLINVRGIIKHFNPKIEKWLSVNGLSTPTEQQILDIVKKNYDSLTLKLQDSLEQYERYCEKPKHEIFFNQMVESIVKDTRCNINISYASDANQ
ncbi:hypothetical protein WA026_010141 [Henosepilachna vigintioctopunctata]|uniref:Armadillo-like helical domain-containing protein n=1 Tax=Henosepilachna vigintioctopunctata TaxID=420089 RepID=A0AAW1UC90_9CUCU